MDFRSGQNKSNLLVPLLLDGEKPTFYYIIVPI